MIPSSQHTAASSGSNRHAAVLLGLALCCACLFIAAPACAQGALQDTTDAPPRPLDADPSLEVEELRASDLEFNLTAGVWLPRLGGDIKSGPSAAARTFSIENAFDLDNLEPSLNVQLDVRKGDRWRLHFGAFDFSTRESGVFPGFGAFGPLLLSAGDAYRTEFDLASFNLEVGYRKWRPIANDDLTLQFSPGFGIRSIHLDHEFEQVGVGVVDQNSDWLALYGTIQMNARINTDHLFPALDNLEVTGAFGGGPILGSDSGFVAHIRTDARAWLTPNFALLFGYNFLAFDATDDDYEIRASIKGLYIGGSLRY